MNYGKEGTEAWLPGRMARSTCHSQLLSYMPEPYTDSEPQKNVSPTEGAQQSKRHSQLSPQPQLAPSKSSKGKGMIRSCVQGECHSS